MKVYIIFGDSPRSDGKNIEGIYFSKEKAKEDIKDLECCYFGEIKYSLEEFEINDEPSVTPQGMTKEEVKELISEMWELLFQEMRRTTFEDISENGRLEKYTEAHSLVIEALEQMPYNTLYEPKTGHWVNTDETHSKCDRCGAVFEIASENGEVNYCPNCGAKMEVEE